MTSTYTYGADGLRRSSTVSGITTYYVYDGQTIIREMKMNGYPISSCVLTKCRISFRCRILLGCGVAVEGGLADPQRSADVADRQGGVRPQRPR